MIIGTVKVGKKFDVCYVNNLFAMIKRNVEADFTFICITDDPTGMHPDIQTKQADPNVGTWWHFMEYYSNDWFETEHRVYFGLDTIIRGDITEVVQRCDYTLSMDFNYLVGNPNKLYANTWADCAAVIPKGGMPWLYEAFQEEHKKTDIGKSQYPMHVWVTHQLIDQQIQPALWQDIRPDAMCSYKWPSPKIDEPKEPMVFFHGPPAIHEVLGNSPWIKDHWHARDLE
jgi:hypothetical protein